MPALLYDSASSAGVISSLESVDSALAGLIVIFAVVYAFTRGSQPSNTNQLEPALVADPNSQAVEPSPPPTGSAEQGIPSGGTTNTQVVDANANANVEASPSPDANINAESKHNAGVNENLITTQRQSNRLSIASAQSFSSTERERQSATSGTRRKSAITQTHPNDYRRHSAVRVKRTYPCRPST